MRYRKNLYPIHGYMNYHFFNRYVMINTVKETYNQ